MADRKHKENQNIVGTISRACLFPTNVEREETPPKEINAHSLKNVALRQSYKYIKANFFQFFFYRMIPKSKQVDLITL